MEKKNNLNNKKLKNSLNNKNNKIIVLLLAVFVIVVIIVTICSMRSINNALPKAITTEYLQKIRSDYDKGKNINMEYFKDFEGEESTEGIYKIYSYSLDDKYSLKVYTYNTIIKEILLENKVTFDEIDVLTDDLEYFIYYQ